MFMHPKTRTAIALWCLTVALTTVAEAAGTSVARRAEQATSTRPTAVIRQQHTNTMRPKVLTTTLKLVVGSGEFEFIENEMVVTDATRVKLHWQTQESAAVSARWSVRDRADPTTVIATGTASSVPPPGAFRRIYLDADAFLRTPGPPADTFYDITLQALDAAGNPLGNSSNVVTVKQLSADYVQTPTDFGAGASFPVVEAITLDEQVRQVPLTQLYSTHADVRLRVSNDGNAASDPMLLTLRDAQLLYRQSPGPRPIPSLAPGESMVMDVRLEAILPPARSQTPQTQQVREWHRRHHDACGPELHSVLDWQGDQSYTPIDPHREALLAMEGWGDYTVRAPSKEVCDGNQCVKLCDIEKELARRLDNKAVGYAYALVGNAPKFGAAGKARTHADGDVAFTPDTPMTVASVSKWITAIGAMSVANGRDDVSIDDRADAYYPGDWSVSNYFRGVTLSQFLSQQSGIKDYGNVSLDDSALEAFFEQPVQPDWSASCTGPDVKEPDDAVNPSAAMTRCYSNLNFAVFRRLLPAMARAGGDPDSAYERLVRQQVFERVGRNGTGCRPRGSQPHAFGYQYPGNDEGEDWGDVRDECGGAGWYVSAVDMAKVLASINARDGLILTETSAQSDLNTMAGRGLGLDTFNNGELSKNGAWGRNDALVHAGAAIFGPTSGPNVVGVLLVNSDIVGGPNAGQNAINVLRDAYNAAVYTR